MTLQPTSTPANLSTEATCGKANHTNGTQEEADEWIYTVIPVYIFLIMALGVVLNLFVLIVLCLHKKACTVAEIYLSNLAAADLVLVSCLPFWAVNVSNRFNWPFGSVMCKVVNLGINMNAYCSIYFLVLVSIDRYVALVHPLSHERIRRPKYAKLGCAIVWALGLLLGVPTLIFREVKYFHEHCRVFCYLNYTSTKEFMLIEGSQISFSFIIPIFIIFCCTLKIIQALNNRATVGSNSFKTEPKATTLVLTVLLAFLICWVPYHVVRLLDLTLDINDKTNSSFKRVLYICNHVFTYLAFFNSALNPILYVLVGKNFRKKVKDLFRQWSNDRTSTLNLTFTRSGMSRRVTCQTASS